MSTWLLYYWDRLRTSYWFIPSVMGLASIALAVLMILIDRAVSHDQWLSWAYSGGPEGARAVLSTVAGSMITVAGVAFSITMVALSLASSQFGPRLLRSFIRDRSNQFVLGTFIATFLYCLIVLRTIRGSDDLSFVPDLAVTVGVGLAVFSLAVLIYFIHHVAISMQVTTIITNVGHELLELLENRYPTQIGKSLSQKESEVPPRCQEPPSQIEASRSGYLVAIRGEALIELARKHDLIIRLPFRPGHFILEKSTLAEVWAEKSVPSDLVQCINDAFVLDHQRTTIQDVEFAVEQLVEIALRALSPGINDPYTAIGCIDHLGKAMAWLVDREPPSLFRYDKEDRLRVIVAHHTTLATTMDAAFHPMRQAASGHTMIFITLMTLLATLGARATRAEDRAILERHAGLLQRAAQRDLQESEDYEEVLERHQLVKKALKLDLNQSDDKQEA